MWGEWGMGDGEMADTENSERSVSEAVWLAYSPNSALWTIDSHAVRADPITFGRESARG